jgi:hypothetical protein
MPDDKRSDPRSRFCWYPGDVTVIKSGTKALDEAKQQAPKRKRGKTIEIKTD